MIPGPGINRRAVAGGRGLRDLSDPKQRLLPLSSVETAVPLDEPPFLRPEHRVRRTRRTRLGRLLQVVQLGGVILLGLSALWGGYARVMASQRLRVGRLEVLGTRFLSEGEVRELLGPAVGENILGLDMGALRSRLQASPWVADATVVRTLPDTLRVEVRERLPLALAEMDRLYLMDAEGKLIDMYGPRTAGFDLPIVRGLAGIGPELRRERAERAGALLHDLGAAAEQVSEVFALASGDLRLVLRGQGEVLLMGRPPYHGAFVAFLGLRKELVARCPHAEYFDLRFRGHIFAKQHEEPPVAPPAAPPPRPDTRPAAAPLAEAGHPRVALEASAADGPAQPTASAAPNAPLTTPLAAPPIQMDARPRSGVQLQTEAGLATPALTNSQAAVGTDEGR